MVGSFPQTASSLQLTMMRGSALLEIDHNVMAATYQRFNSEAVGQRFKTRAGQIRQSIANGSPLLRHFFRRSCVTWALLHGQGASQLVTRFGILQQG